MILPIDFFFYLLACEMLVSDTQLMTNRLPYAPILTVLKFDVY